MLIVCDLCGFASAFNVKQGFHSTTKYPCPLHGLLSTLRCSTLVQTMVVQLVCRQYTARAGKNQALKSPYNTGSVVVAMAGWLQAHLSPLHYGMLSPMVRTVSRACMQSGLGIVRVQPRLSNMGNVLGCSVRSRCDLGSMPRALQAQPGRRTGTLPGPVLPCADGGCHVVRKSYCMHLTPGVTP